MAPVQYVCFLWCISYFNYVLLKANEITTSELDSWFNSNGSWYYDDDIDAWRVDAPLSVSELILSNVNFVSSSPDLTIEIDFEVDFHDTTQTFAGMTLYNGESRSVCEGLWLGLSKWSTNLRDLYMRTFSGAYQEFTGDTAKTWSFSENTPITMRLQVTNGIIFNASVNENEEILEYTPHKNQQWTVLDEGRNSGYIGLWVDAGVSMTVHSLTVSGTKQTAPPIYAYGCPVPTTTATTSTTAATTAETTAIETTTTTTTSSTLTSNTITSTDTTDNPDATSITTAAPFPLPTLTATAEFASTATVLSSSTSATSLNPPNVATTGIESTEMATTQMTEPESPDNISTTESTESTESDDELINPNNSHGSDDAEIGAWVFGGIIVLGMCGLIVWCAHTHRKTVKIEKMDRGLQQQNEPAVMANRVVSASDNDDDHDDENVDYKEVKDWLQHEVQLPNYFEPFIHHGFFTLFHVCQITEASELQEIGIDSHNDRLKILSAIRNLQARKFSNTFVTMDSSATKYMEPGAQTTDDGQPRHGEGEDSVADSTEE